MQSIAGLSAFVAAAERGTFTAAAKHLGVSKSHVSRRVSALEERLGKTLFHRTTRKMVLTEFGAAFYRRCQEPLRQLEALESSMVEALPHLEGRLRISAPLAFGLRSIAPVLAEFSARHPAVTLDVEYTDSKVDIVGGGFDLAIRGGLLDDSSLRAQWLRGVSLLLVASKDYLRRHPPIREPRDLKGCDVITFAPEGKVVDTLPFYKTERGKPRRIKVHPRMIANNADARLAAAIKGLGIALVPSFVLDDRVPVVKVLPQYHLRGKRNGFWVVTPPSAQRPRAVTALVETLLETLYEPRG